jgi:hypothetical protein
MVFNRCWRLQIENRSCWYLWERFSVVAYNWRKYIYYQNGLQKVLSLTRYENGFFTSQNLGVAVGLKCCSVLYFCLFCILKYILWFNLYPKKEVYIRNFLLCTQITNWHLTYAFYSFFFLPIYALFFFIKKNLKNRGLSFSRWRRYINYG